MLFRSSRKRIVDDYADAQSYGSLEALLADASVELVVVNTPTATHFDYAKKSLEAGKQVIVEKAFTTTVAEAQELQLLAESRGLVLSVFQNRRWDSDYRTVARVCESGVLGNLTEAKFRFSRYRLEPGPKAHVELPGAGAGLLNDLGPHLIDQALALFGMPESLFSDVRTTRPASQVDDWFMLYLYYGNGLRVTLNASLLISQPMPAFEVHGTKGSFVKARADGQEAELKAGGKPRSENWFIEKDADAGILTLQTEAGPVTERTISEEGNYLSYYEGIYRAVRDGASVPVSAADGVRVMQIIEAARESSLTRCVVGLP